MYRKWTGLTLAAALLILIGPARADDYGFDVPEAPAQPVTSAAKTYSDVPYLDESRDVPTYGGRENNLVYRSRMHIWVPPGEGPFPCIVYVHGGGYGSGHARRFQIWNEGAHEGRKVNPRELGMRKGYVLVAMNYILGGDGIHPQVQRDFKEAVRFLRANAKRYRIAPNRIGALGGSAGGWLITSGGLTTADHFGFRSQKSHLLADRLKDPDAWSRGFKIARKGGDGEAILLSSFDEARPRHPQISSRLSAMVFDLCHQMDSVSPDDPEMLSVAGTAEKWWARKGKVDRQELLKQKLTLVNYGKHNPQMRKGGALHIPNTNMVVPSADGNGTVTAIERIFQFYDAKLKGRDARTPAAEVRPNERFFRESVEITFATAGPDTNVHYTLDGSEPTTDSPLADHPIKLTDTTNVKFIAVADGMEPSGAATATFIKGDPLPRATQPDTDVLPIATVGEPYEVTFKAPGAKHWHFKIGHPGNKRHNKIKKDQGHDALRRLRNRNYNLFMVGLDCDQSGRLFGTPDQPGAYVLQVMTARTKDAPAGCRTYTLVIKPKGASK